MIVKDNVIDILGYLSHSELYAYGASSKRCQDSAEHEWKRRLEQVLGQRIDNPKTHTPFYWCMQFKNHIKHTFEQKMNQITANENVFENDTFAKDKSQIPNVCELVLLLPEVKLLATLQPVLKRLKGKLLEYWYDLDYEMYDIARKYFSILFPKEYEKIMIDELFNEYPTAMEGWDSGKEEEDL